MVISTNFFNEWNSVNLRLFNEEYGKTEIQVLDRNRQKSVAQCNKMSHGAISLQI